MINTSNKEFKTDFQCFMYKHIWAFYPWYNFYCTQREEAQKELTAQTEITNMIQTDLWISADRTHDYN